MIAPDTPQGTSVSRFGPAGEQHGTTASPVDTESGRVMVEWEGEAGARTEDSTDLYASEDRPARPQPTGIVETIAQRVLANRLFMGGEDEALILAEDIAGALSGLTVSAQPNQPRIMVMGERQPLLPDPRLGNPMEVLGDPGARVGSPEPAPASTAGRSESQAIVDLRQWWMGKASEELEPMLAKMNEYGGDGRAVDLIDIGRQMASILGYGTITDAIAQEWGIFFYVVGKMGRWHAAMRERRQVSDDTLHDIGIYVRMVQRVRAAGGWPQ